MTWRLRVGRRLRPFVLPLAVIAFFAIAVRDLRKAVTGTALIMYFCGYSLIQFQRRHTFHLDVVAVAIVLVVMGAAWSSALWLRRGVASGRSLRSLLEECRGPLLRATAAAFALVLAGGSVLTLARMWQQAHVAAVLERTLTAEWSAAAVTREPLAPFLEQRREPLTQWFAYTLKTRDPGHTAAWWSSGVLLRVAAAGPEQVMRDARDTIRTSYMRVEIDGSRCTAGLLPVAALYSSATPTIDSDFSRAFTVPVAPGGLAYILMPVIEVPGLSRFEGFAVPAGQDGCIRDVRRAVSPARIALPVLFAVLPDNWRAQPLYQRLDPHTAFATGWSIDLDQKKTRRSS